MTGRWRSWRFPAKVKAVVAGVFPLIFVVMTFFVVRDMNQTSEILARGV
jgi:hypothetical protein